jgi:ribosome-binding factor A
VSKIRQQRVAEGLRAELMDLLQNHMRDPRLQLVTVTDVTIDRELRHASVFVSALADAEGQQQIMKALEGAAGFLRREIARRIHLKVVPEMRFHWDAGMERGERIGQILDHLEIPVEETPEKATDSELGETRVAARDREPAND